LVFPHVHIADCGHQVAAVVNACLNSGADQVLAIGVLHAWTDEMVAARASDSGHPLRRVFGEGLDNPIDVWERDHSMHGFKRMFADACALRGVVPPKLVVRYPFLTGASPETLPGIQELQSLAADSVVVSTADHCHHGIGYGHEASSALGSDEAGLATVRGWISEGLALLDEGRVSEYLEHCVTVTKSDWRDPGPVVRYLRGPLRSTIIDMIASDFSDSIYQAPKPTWCAGALVVAEG